MCAKKADVRMATDRQTQTLGRLGVKVVEGLTFDEASSLIGKQMLPINVKRLRNGHEVVIWNRQGAIAFFNELRKLGIKFRTVKNRKYFFTMIADSVDGESLPRMKRIIQSRSPVLVGCPYGQEVKKMELKLLEIKRATDREIKSSQDVHDLMQAESKADRECLWVLHLNRSDCLIEKELVSMGTLTDTFAGSREVFRRAVINSSESIICVHNHPSGNPSPSEEDLDAFARFYRAGRVLGIEVLDCIILGKDGFFALSNVLRELLKQKIETPGQKQLFTIQEATCVECGERVKSENIVYVGRMIYCPYCWEVCFGKMSVDWPPKWNSTVGARVDGNWCEAMVIVRYRR